MKMLVFSFIVGIILLYFFEYSAIKNPYTRPSLVNPCRYQVFDRIYFTRRQFFLCTRS